MPSPASSSEGLCFAPMDPFGSRSLSHTLGLTALEAKGNLMIAGPPGLANRRPKAIETAIAS